MNEKDLDKIIAMSRKRHGFCPLTPEEAESAYQSAEEKPLPKGFIDSVLKRISGKEEELWEPSISYDWMEETKYSNVEDDVLLLHRNKGDDGDHDKTEEELRNELLSEDDDEDGMDGETKPPR